MSAATTARVVLVTALACEARPLIRRLGLRRADPEGSEGGGPPLWLGEGVALVRSGVGRVAAASAVGWAAGRLGAESPGGRAALAFLGFGVAGGRRRAPGAEGAGAALRAGDLVLASRVDGGARPLYPPPVLDVDLPLCPVTTVDAVEREYAADGVYEMEAAGFVEAARRFAPAELVQVLKVVSDTPEDPVDALDAKRIEALVEESADSVATVVLALGAVAREWAGRGIAVDEVAAVAGERRFTTTERRRLRRLLERWVALGASLGAARELVEGASDAAAVLERLEAGISARIGGGRGDDPCAAPSVGAAGGEGASGRASSGVP